MIQYLQILLTGRLARDERGASAVEYGLLVALIAVAIIVAVTALSDGLQDTFEAVTDKLGITEP